MQEDEMIDIVGIYKMKIPCNFFHVGKIPVLLRCRMRAWTGYEKTTSNNTNTEEMVYITKISVRSMRCVRWLPLSA